MDERSDLLESVTDNLPEEKPRQISGLGLPEEILQGIAAGIDLFDSSKDTSPIVDGCCCYTCKNHTKAYINHLLNVHEIHNTHPYLGFFRTIREAMKGGKFEEFHQKFVENRRNFIF